MPKLHFYKPSSISSGFLNFRESKDEKSAGKGIKNFTANLFTDAVHPPQHSERTAMREVSLTHKFPKNKC